MSVVAPPNPVKRRHHHGDLRNALLAAASALLEEDGAEGVSVREVARRVGVSPRAPYRHFPTKEDLLTALAAAAFADLGRVLSEADAAAAPGREVEEQAVAYVAFAQAAPVRFRLMFGPRSSDPASPLAELKRNAFTASDRRLRALRLADGEGGPLLLGHWAFAHGLAQLSLDAHLAGAIGPGAEDIRRITRATLVTAAGGEADSPVRPAPSRHRRRAPRP